MKVLHKILLILAAASFAAACGKTVSPEEDSPLIRLRSFTGTRADGETAVDRSQQPAFLFWTEGNFNNSAVEEPDFFVCLPENVIDAYAEKSYNTRIPYPTENRPVSATGFAPAPGDGYLQFVSDGDYAAFTIPENTSGTTTCPDDKYGVMDVLAAKEVVSGSNSSHIADPLEFIHAQTKLIFRATAAPTMTKFVKFIQVQFPGSLTPVSLEWNDTDEVYEVKGQSGTDAEGFVFGNFWTTDGILPTSDSRANWTMATQISSDRNQNMGYTYIVPPCATSIDVHILYKMSECQDGFDTGRFREMDVPVTIEFVDGNNDPVELKAGDAYLITLVFDTYNIEMTGQLRDWVDGGYISLPYQLR